MSPPRGAPRPARVAERSQATCGHLWPLVVTFMWSLVVTCGHSGGTSEPVKSWRCVIAAALSVLQT
eukprot:4561609-Pyramimonas_sp.AAC.2